MPDPSFARKPRTGMAEEAGMDAACIERIRTRAREWVESGITPSLALLAARRGVVVLNEAFGISRAGETTPLRNDSIFNVASFTKSFTAAAILRLVDAGLVGLNRPAADYIPEMARRGARDILVVDLLTHTSGIDDALVTLDDESISAGKREAAEGQHPLNAAFVKATARAPLASKPGAMMRYASFGYVLLADLVRRVSGRPFARFLEEEIFRPLGMQDTRIGRSGYASEDRLVVRAPSDAVPPAPFGLVPVDEWPAVFAGGMGAFSTTADVARFAQMLLDGGAHADARVLSEASAAAMTRAQIEPGVPAVWSVTDAKGTRVDVPIRGGSYGFGVFLFPYDRTRRMNGSLLSPSAFGHSGGSGCTWWADPERELVGVYLSVMPRWAADGTYLWSGDLYMNLVHASVVGR